MECRGLSCFFFASLSLPRSCSSGKAETVVSSAGFLNYNFFFFNVHACVAAEGVQIPTQDRHGMLYGDSLPGSYDGVGRERDTTVLKT